MKTLQFKITIDASKEKVWKTLWEDATYREWTSVFSEGSRAESDWEVGSKVLFLNNENEGLVSSIAEKKPYDFISFRHLGEVKGGIEDLDSPQTREWAGAMENYTLNDVNGKTELIVDIDITDSHESYFAENWPKAMDKLKVISER